MAQTKWNCNYLHAAIVWLLLNVVINAHTIVATPLCGTMDGSAPPKDQDKIYFKDRTQGIRTVEVNGTVYACYPDGTMIDTTSSAQSSDSGETIDDTTLHSRIQSGTVPFSFYLSDDLSQVFAFVVQITFSSPLDGSICQTNERHFLKNK